MFFYKCCCNIYLIEKLLPGIDGLVHVVLLAAAAKDAREDSADDGQSEDDDDRYLLRIERFVELLNSEADTGDTAFLVSITGGGDRSLGRERPTAAI